MKNDKYEGTAFAPDLFFDGKKQAEVFKEYFRRSCDKPQFNQFMPIYMESSAQGFTIRFGIAHHFDPDHCFNTIDGVSPFQFFSENPKKKEDLHSYLELGCTRQDDKWVLDLVCCMYTDFIEYNLEQSGLLAFLKSQMQLDMTLNKGTVFLGGLSLATKSIAIHGITLNEVQFNRVLNEMLKHEGNEPAHGIWIPEGSIRTLQESMDWEQRTMSFFPSS